MIMIKFSIFFYFSEFFTYEVRKPKSYVFFRLEIQQISMHQNELFITIHYCYWGIQTNKKFCLASKTNVPSKQLVLGFNSRGDEALICNIKLFY